jgi:hypothetical protein
MMRRRAVLAGAAGLAATAGCLSLPESEDSHPFAGETVTVRVDEQSTTPHDLQANAAETLAFWEENSETYAGFEVDFEVVAGETPDLVIAYVDEPQGCADVEGYSERVLGCAPVLQSNTRVPEPTVARVVAGPRLLGKITITAKHEIGHILGLGHDDEPREIMSDRPADRIPLYDLRVEIWEMVRDGAQQTNEASALYTEAVDLWNGGEYDAAGATFGDARETFADAVATFETAHGTTDEFERRPQVEMVALGSVRERLSTLAERVGQLASAARTMVEAADAAAVGDTETANAQRNEANDHVDAFREGGSVQLREVAIALGLVRGFDRDDTVVEFGEEDT